MSVRGGGGGGDVCVGVEVYVWGVGVVCMRVGCMCGVEVYVWGGYVGDVCVGLNI